ncbi:MAG: carbon monoxide dehydrogenase subunit G [Pseudomonadota bacterium]
MEMTGEYTISAPRERVFEALNDPEVLRACIPGCESLEKLSDNEMEATVVAKVGPVRAKFKGQVTLSDLVYPESYRITGSGKGGTAGHAKGGATVRLAPNGSGTVMSYEVQADVGGKLAQLGGRLIDSTSKKMADDFFKSFAEQLSSEQPAEEAAAPEPASAAEAAPPEANKGISPIVWLIGVGVIVIAVAYLLTT